ncbi:MAG: hypothetical protein IPK83_20365 [Planctomycetes bacterium]|nr:hypothetical protein [Planctomycetota bacterium]
MSFLGSSPVTSILGYVTILITVAQQVVTEQGMPSDTAGWIKLVGGIIIGIGLRFSKDANVSNAPVPAEASKVQ